MEVALTGLNCDLSTFLSRELQGPELELCDSQGVSVRGPSGSFSQRNLVSLFMLLRVLKKVVHRHPLRERALVQFKAPDIFKRSLLTVDCPFVRLYSLKIIKPLIKYLNPRWRASKNVSLACSSLKGVQRMER